MARWNACPTWPFSSGGRTVVVVDTLYLLTPTVSSPAQLCEWLTAAARGALREQGVALQCKYDATQDEVRLTGVCDVPGTMVRILPGPLASLLGVSTAPVELRDTAPRVWPSGKTQLWDYVTVPPGFYAPCHRPMCVGQPLRLGTELEAAVNRLYFPLATDRVPAGSMTPHLLLFSDANGRTLTCPIPCGRYTPTQFCDHLEAEMTRVAAVWTPGITFSVTHGDDDRFVFACERRDPATERIEPASFGLLFHHPLCIDPARLGFAAQPLSGSHTYVASEPTHVAVVEGTGRYVTNVLRIGENAPQKRFRIHATHPPSMQGVVVAAGALTRDDSKEGGGGASRGRRLSLRTYVNKLPFAHGYQAGDVVRLSATAATVTQESEAGGKLEEVDVTASPARFPASTGHVSCIVLASRGAAEEDPCLLDLHCPALDGLDELRSGVLVTSDGPEPWNLCFCKPQTLPPHLMGFPAKAVQWGVDGSVGDDAGGKRRIPPYEAPHTHCLDHPDYVLLTFSEAAGAGLEHTFNGETKSIFCKLSLYPLFREERMLPRDTALASHNVTRFTIAFWNPDMRTPYRFHGAEFSFSLAFFSSVPDPPSMD